MDVSNSQNNSSNSNVIRYIIVGNPIPLARGRFSNGHVWDSQKKLKFAWAQQLEAQHKDLPVFMGVPLHIDLDFYMQTPRLTAANKLKIYGKYHDTRPDLDNLIKWVNDVATGVCWSDDCIIASMSCKKIYAKDPRTEFSIRVLSESKSNLKKESAFTGKRHISQCDDIYCRQNYCPRYYDPNKLMEE